MTLAIEPPPVPLSAEADGTVRVGGTRVTLDTVVGAYKLGATPESLAEDYDVLTLPQVYAVIAYYLSNRDAVDDYLAGREREANQIRRQNEQQYDRAEIRQRLQSRRSSSG
jgi:uncharacterized protein (DUF433 family)